MPARRSATGGVARRAARDLERMLWLDVDGTDFAALGERDDSSERCSDGPGLRPFCSTPHMRPEPGRSSGTDPDDAGRDNQGASE